VRFSSWLGLVNDLDAVARRNVMSLQVEPEAINPLQPVEEPVAGYQRKPEASGPELQD